MATANQPPSGKPPSIADIVSRGRTASRTTSSQMPKETPGQAWILKSQDRQFRVDVQILRDLYSRGRLTDTRLQMRRLDSDEWHHPTYFVNEFSLAGELEQEPPAAPLKALHSRRNAAEHHQDKHNDELLYRDRHGYRCNYCNKDSLEWVRIVDFGSAKGMGGGGLACGAVVTLILAWLSWFHIAAEAGSDYDEAVASASTLLHTARIDFKTTEHILNHGRVTKTDYDDLPSDAQFALKSAETKMTNASAYGTKRLLHQSIGVALLFAFLGEAFFAQRLLRKTRLLRCTSCDRKVRN